jgi:trehalose 6-phosphate synthase/phosphatase
MPDAELMELLRSLAANPKMGVHIVSGRSRESMDRWFGELNIGLQAEHGAWSRPRGSREWEAVHDWSTEWKPRVRRVLDDFVEATRESFVEEKSYSLAWHYRNATGDDTEGLPFGDYQARELELVLAELLRGQCLEVLRGNKVREVRPIGLNKSLGVPDILAASPDREVVLAMGDDDTDEDLFAAMPDGSLTVRVGDGATRALYRLRSHEDARQVLAALLT